jgi:hypothetical protein
MVKDGEYQNSRTLIIQALEIYHSFSLIAPTKALES